MNKGLNLQKEQEELRGDEYKFGSNSKPSIFSIEMSQREKYLPFGEIQNMGEEKYDCVTRAYVNKLEAEFTYAYDNNLFSSENKAWLMENGYVVNEQILFSDAFIAILSGTTQGGNSLKAPAHAIHKQGLIPKHLLPQLHSFKDNYDIKRISAVMYRLGQDFLKRFPIEYEQVDAVNIDKSVEIDMTAIALHAWTHPIQGEYPRTEAPENHCVLAFKLPKTYIFDNYLDIHDNDFIKKLAPNYKIYPYGYRVYVTEQNGLTEEQIKGFWEIITDLWKKVFKLEKDIQEVIKPPTVITPSSLDVLYEVSKGLLGKRLTLDKSVPYKIGCSDAMSFVLKKAGYNIPQKGIPYTPNLYKWLKENFDEIPKPEKGCVIISPTENQATGHVGCIGAHNYMYKNDYAVMSNNSDTGKYSTHWKLTEWKKYYEDKLGLDTYYFKPRE